MQVVKNRVYIMEAPDCCTMLVADNSWTKVRTRAYIRQHARFSVMDYYYIHIGEWHYKVKRDFYESVREILKSLTSENFKEKVIEIKEDI